MPHATEAIDNDGIDLGLVRKSVTNMYASGELRNWRSSFLIKNKNLWHWRDEFFSFLFFFSFLSFSFFFFFFCFVLFCLYYDTTWKLGKNDGPV